MVISSFIAHAQKKRGGGVGVVIKNNILTKLYKTTTLSSFEYIDTLLSHHVM